MLLLVLLCCAAVGAEIFPSPCPRLFAYDPTSNETDKWYGTLTLLSDSDLLDVWLRLSFDKPSIQLGNWFGQVETSDSKEYHIRKHNFELKAHVPYQFRFFLKFDPEERAPKLLSFRLNGKLVCPEESPSGVTKFSPTFSREPDAYSRDSAQGPTFNTRDPDRSNTRNPDPSRFGARDPDTSRFNARDPDTSRFNARDPDTNRYNTRDPDTRDVNRFTTRDPNTHTTKVATREPEGKDDLYTRFTGNSQSRVTTGNNNRVTTHTAPRLDGASSATVRPANGTQSSGTKFGVQDSNLNRFNSRNTAYLQPKDATTSLGSSVASRGSSASSHGSSAPSHGSSVSAYGSTSTHGSSRPSASSGSSASAHGSFASSASSQGSSVSASSYGSASSHGSSKASASSHGSVPSQGSSVSSYGSSVSSHGISTSSHGGSVSSHGSPVPSQGSSVSSYGSPVPSRGGSVSLQGGSVSSFGNSVTSSSGGMSFSSRNRLDAVTTEKTTTNYVSSDFENSRTTKPGPERTSAYAPDEVVYPQDISYGYDTQSTHTQNRDRNRDSNPQDYICGTALPQARPLIAYGDTTHDGEFPWHAALYRAKHTKLTYFCGASLVSRRYLVTAAHCMIKSDPEESYKAEELFAHLGKQNLKRFNAGFQDHEVAEIIPHPQFNPETYRNDIALLKLTTLANVTSYVRPVCLWKGATDIELIISKIGSVVGWGYDESGIISEELMQAKMPIVSRERCISSYPSFYRKFTWANSYCGGFANGTSPCNGDAGGGMVFPVPNSSQYNPVWQIRGLISILPATQNQLCDVTHYAVFTDVAKYLDWVASVMQ